MENIFLTILENARFAIAKGYASDYLIELVLWSLVLSCATLVFGNDESAKGMASGALALVGLIITLLYFESERRVWGRITLGHLAFYQVVPYLCLVFSGFSVLFSVLFSLFGSGKSKSESLLSQGDADKFCAEAFRVMLNGDADESLRIIDLAISQWPANPKLLEAKGNLLSTCACALVHPARGFGALTESKQAMDLSRGAYSFFGQALKIDPRRSSALLARGNLRYMSGDRDGAHKDIKSALLCADKESEKVARQMLWEIESGIA